MTSEIALERNGAVAILRFNRPEKKNALTDVMYRAAADGLLEAEADTSVRAILIVGSGGSFTAGNDLKDFLSAPPVRVDAGVWRFMTALREAKKPVVAAVNGVAVGIGTTLLFHCDLVIAGDDARFSMPFINLALVPEFASSMLLPAVAGHRVAAELLMLGEPFGAEKAKEAGIINRIVPAAEAEAAGLELAQKLALKPAAPLRMTKELLKTATETIAERIAREGAAFGAALQTAEAKEAFSAFLEKRAPDFTKVG